MRPAHHAIAATSAPAPATPAVHHAAAAPAPAAKPAAPVAKAAAPAPAHTAKPAVIGAIPANAGVLMISSKPPCEILVDGKSTHMMTPQTRLVLQPGPHTITLVNPAQHIQNSTKVEILAGLPSRMIKDFTH